MGKKYTFTAEQAENIAAIAFHMGRSPLWQAAYKAAANRMGGSVGFYQVAMEMAISLEEYASYGGGKGIDWDEEADWIQTTENVAEKVIDFMISEGKLPSAKERKEIVKNSIVLY